MGTPAPRSTPAEDDAGRRSRRERRIEEQRRRIDTVRRQQRRRRALWGTLVLVAVAIVAALALLLIRPPAAAQGRQVPLEGADHVAPGTPLTYRSRPPTSGPHYPSAAEYGVSERPIDPGNWVHTLEHGGIVVLYRPDQCDRGCVDELRQAYTSAPRSRFGNVKMVVTPYGDMDHRVAVVAWGWVDEMDEVDRDRILAFYRSHVDRGPEQVP